jgi:hypothetical protein
VEMRREPLGEEVFGLERGGRRRISSPRRWHGAAHSVWQREGEKK